MKNFAAKLGLTVGLAALVAISATVGALADAHLRIGNATYGVESGSSASVTLVCVDKNKDIANGVTIRTSHVPIVWAGHRGTGVTGSCP